MVGRVVLPNIVLDALFYLDALFKKLTGKGVNGLLGYKAQICLYPKEKIGILTAILPEEIRFNFWVFV